MVSARRQGSDSRVCKPWDAPYEWRWYVDEGHSGPVELEEWLCGLTVVTRGHVEGQLDELFDAASGGLLEDTGDETTPIKPIHRDPEIFELRITQLNKMLRFYHGEPRELESELVALHEHIKIDNKTQDQEIGWAAKHYRRGRVRYWQ